MPQRRHPVPRQVLAGHREDWLRVRTSQHGAIDTEQLRSFGIGREVISANVAAGRWQPVVPRVYATFTGPLPRESQIAAALLYAGPAALVSHRTAAEIWGMRPPSSGPVHVTVAYNCSAVSQLPLVVVHRSRAFQHLGVDSSPPLTSRADTVIDLAVAETTARAAQRTLTELITSRRVSAAQVQERLADRPPRRYVKALAQAMNRLNTGVESMLEEIYAVDVEAAHGLPAACRQSPFRVDGRMLYEDAVYDHIGIPLTVRLDGQTHLEPDVAYRDRRRDNAAELAARSRLVYGWRELNSRPCSAAHEVAAVLFRHGWQGPFRHCPKCPAQGP